MVIIVAVLVIAVLGGWYLYSSAKPGANTNSNRAANTANTAKTSSIPTNAPVGAQPPNQAGSQNALVTLEEFADFQCPTCATVHPVMNEIKGIYGSRIRFIFRNFPLSIPEHDKSYNAAVAAEAAGLQSANKFWEMQNLLFTNQKLWTKNPDYKQMWKEYAQKIGLDVPKWENDMLGMGAKRRVDDDITRGKAIGINSTPTLYVNGISVPSSDMKVEPLKAMIDAELQRMAAQSQAANAPAAPPANTGNQNK